MKMNLTIACVLAFVSLGVAATEAQATTIYVPASSPTGAGWSLGALNASNPIFLTVSGTPFLQNSAYPANNGTAGYGTNGAGVVTVASPNPANPGGSSNTPVGQALIDGSDGFMYGALIATLVTPNYTKTIQVFSTTNANGFQTASPQTTLSLPTGTTFGSLFGAFAPSATGNFITFKVDDTGFSDNTGGFSVSAAPEPGMWALMFAGLAMIGSALRLRRPQGGVVAA